jgi:hypothetical protein
MKTLIQLSLLAVLASGCIVVPGRHYHRGGYHPAVAARRDCPPSYHWNGNVCVHNGNGRGNGNGNGRR